ncbi:MAG TPA: iron dependent repressor, metal binding and dimerization domain protein [Nitrososphaera sp.]|nr:iron dependent repressor, metal binding and dimerization domain protein [Nitrososphaera sp.]
MQKNLATIHSNKRQENLKRQSKRGHLRNNDGGGNNKNSKNRSNDSRLASIRGANNAKKPECTYRMEDYLEIIYELVQHKGYATLVDVAEYLNVRPPSVTTMMHRLDQSGLLNYEKYRGIKLTERGMDVAKIIHNRHSVLSEFLRMIGVNEKIANEDAESMEHHLHPQTMLQLTELMHTLKVSNHDN